MGNARRIMAELRHIGKTALYTLCICLGIATLHYARRVLVADRFIIPSESMSPTLVPGDKVWVNKLLFGARIYTSLDFGRGKRLECFRMPGFREIRPGDIVVFNFPHGYDDWGRIEFRINYVYCKRVIGTPGDTIGISNSVSWNSRYDGVLGCPSEQEKLQDTPDSVFFQNYSFTALPLSYPHWNIKDWGPVRVPSEGWNTELDELHRHLYRHIIEYETGRVCPDTLKEYTFQGNWYFMQGDNASNSCDSRYWGFVPESFIVGIVFDFQYSSP